MRFASLEMDTIMLIKMSQWEMYTCRIVSTVGYIKNKRQYGKNNREED